MKPVQIHKNDGILLGEPSEIVGENNKAHPNSSQKQKNPTVSGRVYLEPMLLIIDVCFTKLLKVLLRFFHGKNLALNIQDDPLRRH